MGLAPERDVGDGFERLIVTANLCKAQLHVNCYT
jgi:hypothetical protein